MACNICGGKVEICDKCLGVLEHRFFCFEEVHFCDSTCWEDWLVEEEREKLMQAINLDE